MLLKSTATLFHTNILVGRSRDNGEYKTDVM